MRVEHECQSEIFDIDGAEEKLEFPFLRRFHEILSVDLTLKISKSTRQRLQISISEATDIHIKTSAKSLEEYLHKYGQDFRGFR